MAMNRYQGNTGLVERLPETEEEARRPRTSVPIHSTRPPLSRHGGKAGGPGFLGGLEEKLGGRPLQGHESGAGDGGPDPAFDPLPHVPGEPDEQLLLIMGILLFL
jgi:hypothetical protein